MFAHLQEAHTVTLPPLCEMMMMMRMRMMMMGCEETYACAFRLCPLLLRALL